MVARGHDSAAEAGDIHWASAGNPQHTRFSRDYGAYALRQVGKRNESGGICVIAPEWSPLSARHKATQTPEGRDKFSCTFEGVPHSYNKNSPPATGFGPTTPPSTPRRAPMPAGL